MLDLSRRTFLQAAASLAASPALAQQSGAPAPNPFRFEDVIRRAREMAGAPYDPAVPPLPEPLSRLDFDAYRDIRFRPERALLAPLAASFACTCSIWGSCISGP